MNSILRGLSPLQINRVWKICLKTNRRSLSKIFQQTSILLPKMIQHQHQNTPVAHFSNSPSSKFRFWKQISAAEQDSETSRPFKVVSYNILAQDLLVQHLHLYRHANPLHLQWSYRLERLTEQLNEQKADILCLQEVQEDQLVDIMEAVSSVMPHGSFVYKQKTGAKSDGCAIIYNTQLFELISWDVVEFFRPDVELLDRHNIALIAKFRCKSRKNAQLLVGTTHLLFNPNRQDVRLAQTMLLLAELDRHSILKPGELERMPIILAGDFNFQANSAPFQLITTGQLCYERLSKRSLLKPGMYENPTGKCFITDKLRITDNCQHIDCVKSNYKENPKQCASKDSNDCHLFSTGTLTHILNLQSAYDHFDGNSCGSIYQNTWVTVDHVFYSKGDKDTKRATLELLSVFQLPTIKQCREIGNLPNAEHGSDHLMLAAWFYLKFPPKTSPERC